MTKKTIAMCTRVEGHGKLNIFIDKNEISNVFFEIEAFRGFENILMNKRIIDVPRILSRVCGLCYASQTITSCKAIEDAFGIEPGEQSIRLRRLLMVGELLNSHSMHFFLQALPDLFVILNGRKKPLSLSKLNKEEPQMTAKMFELIRIGKNLVGIFGGRTAHPITPVIGGISHAPSKSSLTAARKDLQTARDHVTWVLERFQELFLQADPPECSVGDSLFLGTHNYDRYERYDGMLRLRRDGTNVANFSLKDYSKYLDLDSDRNVPRIYAHHEKEEQKLLVGPISRYHVIEDYGIEEVEPYLEFISVPWRKNILLSNYLRLIEMFVEIHEGLSILEDAKLIKPIEIPTLDSLKNSEGIGAVEAPRGTLIHHYQVNDELVLTGAKLLVATEISIPTINDIITRESKELYEKTKDLEQVKARAQMIVRSFDPCISCATH